MCDMTHSYVWHDSFICLTWLIHVCDMTHSYVWHDSFICVIWLIHICDATHPYVWHDSSICVTWLIHMCDMTHSYVWYDSSIYVWFHSSTRMNKCAVTNSYAGRDACICVNKYVRTYMHAYSRIFKAHVCWQQTGPAHTECLRKKNDNFFLQKKSNQVCDLEYVWSYECIMFHKNTSSLVRGVYHITLRYAACMRQSWRYDARMICVYIFIHIHTHTHKYVYTYIILHRHIRTWHHIRTAFPSLLPPPLTLTKLWTWAQAIGSVYETHLLMWRTYEPLSRMKAAYSRLEYVCWYGAHMIICESEYEAFTHDDMTHSHTTCLICVALSRMKATYSRLEYVWSYDACTYDMPHIYSCDIVMYESHILTSRPCTSRVCTCKAEGSRHTFVGGKWAPTNRIPSQENWQKDREILYEENCKKP